MPAISTRDLAPAHRAGRLQWPVEKLQEKALDIRRDIITLLAKAQTGHSGGPLSSTDFGTALFFTPRRPALLVLGSAVALIGVALIFFPDLSFSSVAGPNAFIFEVCLRRRDLAEEWAPTLFPGDGVVPEVWIEMSARVVVDSDQFDASGGS